MSYTQADYDILLERLRRESDERYRVFNESLIPGTERTYGVRAPALRKSATELLQGDWRAFLSLVRAGSHEERLLQGMVCAGAKCSLDEKLTLLHTFLPRINNWAVCDTTAGACKWKEADLPAVWDFFAPCLQSQQEFEVRFAVVQLMDYFWRAEWIDRSLAAYRTVQHQGYYVTMALAWGLSVFFVKQRAKTLPLLEQGVFPAAVHNKAIQKCRESYRVSAEDKAYLNTLKKK